MRCSHLLFAALPALGMTVPSLKGHLRCGTEDPSPEQSAAALLMQKLEASNAYSRIESNLEIDTYFHVVSSSTNATDGNIPDEMLSQQLSVMNNAYAPHSIQFNLRQVDRTVNATWASGLDEMIMKTALRQGSYSAFNLYFVESLGGSLGFSYLPTTASPNSTNFIRDGSMILYSTVPGGSFTNYNEGFTAVHEAGHWFGLFHTFQGYSCSGVGDMIDDTPQSSGPTSGCPAGRDSCTADPGLDPIHNYMDYSYDSCFTEFTTGQEMRMLSMYNQYRSGK